MSQHILKASSAANTYTLNNDEAGNLQALDDQIAALRAQL